MPGPVFSLRNRSNSYEAPTQCLSSRTIEVEDDICSLSETLSRVSFYPSPDPLSENEQEAPVTSSLPEPSDDLGLYGRPDSASSGLSIVSRRAFTFEDIDPTPSYDLRTSIDSPAVASTQDEEECDVDDWSSESEGSGDDIDGAFTIVSLEEVAFPSLNSSPYANMVPGYFQYYAEEERGRPDPRGHHRYHAEDDYTQPSASEHYVQRGDSFAHFQRGFLPTWSRSISYPSYLAYIKIRTDEAQRREAENMVLWYQMRVADAILNRLRNHSKRRASPRILLPRDSIEKVYVRSPLATEILCC